MAELEKLTSKHTSRDEGLHVGDGDAYPGPDPPKKQKQLILIRLIKSYLKFRAALLTPRFMVTWFDPRRSQGSGQNSGLKWQRKENVCFLILEMAKNTTG